METATRRRPKIALIGSGMIGSFMSQFVSHSELGDVVLFDVVPSMPMGKGFDSWHSSSVSSSACKSMGTNSYADIAGADVVVVTAGLTKVPGKSDKEWSRDDLLPFNAKILREVGENIKKYCPQAFVICVTNPLDVMVGVLQKASGVPYKRICGMAGVLDSARFRAIVAEALHVSPESVQGMVIGAHGDAMIPLPRYCTINGIPLAHFVQRGEISEADVQKFVQRTKHFGGEIVSLLGEGSAAMAPANAAMKMAKAYLHDERVVMPCAVHLMGEYGVKDLYAGVPVVIGKNGVEKIIELEFNEAEKKEWDGTISEIQRLCNKLQEMEAAGGK